MPSDPPCGGDAFTPCPGAPMPAPGQRTCEVCGNATKEAAESAMRDRTGVTVSLPGPYGKCLGTLGNRFLEEAGGRV